MKTADLSLALLALATAIGASEPVLDDVVKAAPVQRGLIVHVCAEDGSLAEALAKANPVVVFALASNAAGEARLRERFAAAGIHGQATAGTLLDGNRLPLNDDLAALLVADLDASGVRRDEALRVVRPFGKAYLKEGGKWQVVDKPRPAELDDWPQYFHDGAMSDLSADKRAGPARGLRWEAGPSTTHSLGVRVMRDVWVSADDGGIVARDAFSGLPLWRRPDILVRNRFAFLADEQRVYVYPEGERDAPAPSMLALDLRTGVTVRDYSEGLTFPALPAKDANVARSVVEALRKRPADMQARLADGILTQNARDDLVALDAASGQRLWSAKSPEGTEWAHPVIAGGKLYAVQGPSANSGSYTHWPMTLVQRIVALDLKSGKELWAWDWGKEMPGVMATQPMPGNHKNVAASLAPPERRAAAAYNMALAGNLLVLAVRSELDSVVAGRGLVRQLVVNAASGKLESYGLTPAGLDKTEGGGHSHLRVLPVKDRVWFVEAISVFGSSDANAPTDTAKFRTDYAKLLRPVGCTVFRASPNYLFGSLTTYALDGSGVQHTNVARTTCDVGAFPANGMSYITPNHCFCQPYLPGNNAFSPRKVQPAEEPQRLERGKGQAAPPAPATEDAWPMFLRDGLRSSWSVGQLPAKLAQ
ncbi:MAG: PQQ-binding-like beta-propeller repeat protein, partial [Planctomycetota bacterium]|nr:PQQ-binding-like beta-propeller repeat protein [Planctomycetota bacterium]